MYARQSAAPVARDAHVSEEESMNPVVEIQGLTKRFRALTAVDDISFSVERGEVLGFLGPNGAGKSTTMKMITGFLAPDAGSIRVGGRDIAEDPVAVKADIGYLPEGAPLYSDMTPRGFLGFVAEVRGIPAARRRSRIEEVVETVHIDSVLNQPIETLSKGFKRRVGLAQAILHDPGVLVLDEPTDGLDPNQKHEVRNLIRGMASEKVIILSTHILEEVDAVCTRAIIISRGRLVSDSTPRALMERSRFHNALSLVVDEALSAVDLEALEALSAAASVEVSLRSESRTELRVLPRPGRALIEEVGALARDRGWRLAEMHGERGRLDEVFREVTSGQLS